MDGSDVSAERLVRTWMASKRDEELSQAVSGISNGSITLLDVVKALGEFLTSEDDDIRSQAVECLSAILARCPPEKINRNSARVLTSFYCSKIEDITTIIPALRGLASLASLPALSSTDALNILDAVFKHVKMRAHEQSVRFSVFTIIDSILAHYREAVRNQRSDFVARYTALAEGEKDPRNLLVAFAIARVILIEFDTSSHIEDLFNITFCYFPISFRPPPGYEFGITADDLRIALRKCLSATHAFGPLAIPLFLEKLTAGSPAVKRDTLQTMADCLPVYGAALAQHSARRLWSSLKLEIFQPTDSLTEEEALKTMQVLVSTIHAQSSVPQADEADVQTFARDVCAECIQILREPEKSQAQPATKVLCAFLATTPSVAQYTLKETIPHFVKLYVSPDEATARPATLALLSDIIAAASKAAASDAEEASLRPFKDEVLGIYVTALKASATRSPALKGLKNMLTTANLLTDEEIGFVVHNVDDTFSDDDQDPGDPSILELLSAVSTRAPRHIEEQTLPLLFSFLPDQPPSKGSVVGRAKCWRILSALEKLCIPAQLFETMVIRLSTKVDLICSRTDSNGEEGAAYVHSILTTLANTLEKKVLAKDADVPKYIERLMFPLYNLFIWCALVDDGSAMTASSDPRVICVAARIITLIMQSAPSQKQQPVVHTLMAVFEDSKLENLPKGLHDFPSEAVFRPYMDGTKASQKTCIPLFAAAIIALHPEVPIPVSDVSAYLDAVAYQPINIADDDAQRDAHYHVIATVVNKRPQDVAAFLQNTFDIFWSNYVLKVPSSSTPCRQTAIIVWSWTSKALLMRNHPDASRFYLRLFELFGDADVGWDAAKALGHIGGPCDVLTKPNHAIIKPLYAQKFFNQVLPRIMDGVKITNEPSQRNAHLVALSALIKNVPRSVYLPEMPSLMPLLLRGLDLPDPTIRSNVIDTLLTTVSASEPESKERNMVAEHAASLVSIMLRNARVSEMPAMKVRIASLKFLAIIPSMVRYDILHPHKAEVLRDLASVLDDPRKAVRKEAVDARTNWFTFHG